MKWLTSLGCLFIASTVYAQPCHTQPPVARVATTHPVARVATAPVRLGAAVVGAELRATRAVVRTEMRVATMPLRAEIRLIQRIRGCH